MKNVFLVRYGGGWAEQADSTSVLAHGPKEGLLTLGAVQDRQIAQDLAQSVLNNYKDIRTEIAVETEPTPLEGIDFKSGDFITVPDIGGNPTEERVLSVTYSEEPNGEITRAVELKDRIFELQERWDQALDTAATGTLKGTTAVGTTPALSPVDTPPLRTPPDRVIVYDSTGVLGDGSFAMARPNKIGNATKALADVWLDGGGGIADDCTIDIEYPFDPGDIGANVIGTITISSGENHGEVDLSGKLVAPNQFYGFVITSVGGGFLIIRIELQHTA